MLTSQQAALKRFIQRYQTERGGESPSFMQMAAALDLRSKSGVHRLLTALEERGHIRRMRNRARAIEVLKTAEAA